MALKQSWPPMIIGWREMVHLPDFANVVIKAKIDTGARTSSLHAWNIRTFIRGTTPWASFELHPKQHDSRLVVPAEAPIVDMRQVKSSSGHVSERIVVKTRIELAGRCWPIELTLAQRDEMGFRMLLGRSAMRGHIMVDPNRSFLAGRHFKPDNDA